MNKRYPMSPYKPDSPPDWRSRLHEIIFEADTWTGKAFDVVLMWSILLSVLAVMIESVDNIRHTYGSVLRAVEWSFTILFTIEYLLRLLCVYRPLRYARSFYGLVDLFAFLPTYLSLVVVGAHSLLVIRTLRLLRVFRVLKLRHFLDQARILRTALQASMPKVTVFLGTVMAIVTIVGTTMYLIEGEENGFTSIPLSIYWAIVTMTTVGYGDLVPQTVPGRLLAATLMIVGYAVIAVPTGIVTVELAQRSRISLSTRSCQNCAAEGHDADARYCKQCGTLLV